MSISVAISCEGVFDLSPTPLGLEVTVSLRARRYFQLAITEPLSLGGLLQGLLKLVGHSEQIPRLPAPFDTILNFSLEPQRVDGRVVSPLLRLTPLSDGTPSRAEVIIAFAQAKELKFEIGGKVFFSLKLFGIRAAYGGGQLDLAADIEIQGQRQITTLPFDPPAPKTPTFQLKYLALGQRLQVPGAGKINSVAEAVDAIEAAMEIPDTGFKDTKIGDWYNADSNWLMATHFLVAETLEFRAIFNDPVLYGLDIRLGGKAGALAGLNFEILYKKVTEDIGEYFIDFSLPTRYRNIQLGAAAIQLPTIQLSIYTNGDFRVALGWPLGDNSLIIQAAGFIGGGGFYFAKLIGELVPALRDKTTGKPKYGSIVAFGLALTIGRGIQIVKGPLTAELTISLFGVFEGLLAWDNAAKGKPDFFYFEATVGIIGVLEGAVDFKVIRASVTVRVVVSASLIFVPPPYQIAVTLHAGVSIAVSLKIAFIKVHFSFHATLTHTFVLQKGTPLDFRIDTLARAMVASLAVAADDAARRTAPMLTRLAATEEDAQAAARTAIPLYFLPQVTATFGDGTAQPMFVASLMIRTRPAKGAAGKAPYEMLVDALLAATVTDGLSSLSFKDLAAMAEAEAEDGLEALADSLINALSEQAKTQRQNKTGSRGRYQYLLATFASYSFDIQTLDQSPEEAQSVAAEDSPGYTVFPMFEEVVISWNNKVADPTVEDPAAGGETRSPLTWTEGLKPPSYAADLADYFEELSSAFRQPDEEPLMALLAGDETTESTALIMFVDYWDLVLREALSRIKETAATKPDAEKTFRTQFTAATAEAAGDKAKVQAAIGVINATFETLIDGQYEAVAAKAAYFLQSGLRLPESFDGGKPGAIEALYRMSGLQAPLQLVADTAFAAALAPDPGKATWTDDAKARGVIVVPAKANGTARDGDTGGGASGRTPYLRGYLDKLSAVKLDNAVHSFEILNGLTPNPRAFALREMLTWQQLPADGDTPAEQRIVAVTAQMAHLIYAAKARFALFGSSDDVRKFARDPNAANAPKPLPLTPALKIPLTLRQARADDTIPHTYEIGGTDETSRRLLDQVLTGGGGATISDIAILFNGDGDVLRSQAMNADKSLIIKTNLSTESRPPPMMAMAFETLAAPAPPPQYASFSQHEQVLRLIWELSIVNSGGFSLYYETADGKDFPDTLFTGSGQVPINLLIRFKPATATSAFLATPAYGEFTTIDTALATVPGYANALVTTAATAPKTNNGKTAEDAAKQQHEAMVYALSDQVEWDATVPPGSVGFRVRRPRPPEPASPNDPGAAQAHVETLYSLMQFRIAATDDFKASPWSVPFGPGQRSTDPDELADMESRAQTPAAITNNDPWWTYEETPAVFRFIGDAPKTPTRYDAVGKALALDFRIGDMFGNWLADATPTTADGKPLMPAPRPLAYWDRLVGVDSIPGWSVSYAVASAKGAPELQLLFAYDAASVIPPAQAGETSLEPPVSVLKDRKAATPSQLEAAKAAWTRCRLILDQLNDGGTALTLTTSLAPAGAVTLDKAVLVGIARQTLDFATDVLIQKSLPDPLPAPPKPVSYIHALDPALADQKSNLFSVEVSVALSRSDHLGEDVATKNPQAKSTVTSFPPKSARADGKGANGNDSYGLGRFAADFEAAFGGQVRLALGRRKWGAQAGGVDAVANGMTLWAVRVGAGGVDAAAALHSVPEKPTPLADYYAPPPLCPKPQTQPTPPRLLDGTFDIVQYSDQTWDGAIWSEAWQQDEAFTGVDLDVWGRAFLSAVDDLLSPDMSVALVRNKDACAAYMAKLQPSAGDDVFSALLTAKEDLAEAVSATIQPVLKPTLGGDLSNPGDAKKVFKERLLIDLSAAYDVSAIVQVPIDVTVAHTWSDTPKYYGAVTIGDGTATAKSETSGIDFSVAKLSLARDTTATPRPLTFLFTAANPAVQSLFIGDLSFDVSFIEHEIADADTPGAFEGYLPSSWLKLIVPTKPDGTRGDGTISIPLGQLAIPVALREFPKPPVLRNQGTLIPDTDPNPQNLRSILDWTYELVFDQAAVAQDSIDLDVIYNERQDDSLAGGADLMAMVAGEPARPAPKDLFEALARFTTEYPQLRPVLEGFTDPSSTPEAEVSKACLAAVRTYALIRDVAVTWLDRPSRAAMMAASVQDLERIVENYRITNNSEDVYKSITIEALTTNANLPAVSFPSTKADPKAPAGSSHTYPLPKALRDKAWRTLTLDYLERNVLTRQNAISQMRVRRNANLAKATSGGDGRETNGQFEYQTATVRFPNVVTPLVDQTGEIRVANGPGAGLKASIAAFLKTLLGPDPGDPHAAPEGQRLMKLAVSYVFDVISAADGPTGAKIPKIPAELPIVMTSDFLFSFPVDYEPDNTEGFVSKLAAAIHSWHVLNHPAKGTSLKFDLTVFANLSQAKLPILRLRHLTLPLSGADDSWWAN